LKKNDFSLAKNYKAIPLLKKSFFRYLDTDLSAKVVSLVKKEKYDVIIWEHPYYAWLAYKVKRQTAITTILHSHNIEYQRFKTLGKWWWPILKVYEKWFSQFADFIFYITAIDKKFAIEHWYVPVRKAIDVPFGIEIDQYPRDRENCKLLLRTNHRIREDETILLFNGSLDYKPNLDALMIILKQINPILLSHQSFKYKILICGKGLPGELNELKEYKNENIIYTGFVNHIETYFKGADLFLNPVQTGGGIKTKMVEAIGFGTTVIATENGATGMDIKLCGKKLIVVKDNDWYAFGQVIIKYAYADQVTPPEYYNYYYYRNIVRNIMKGLNTL
jgi:glycosyltransferase involved in cell wall biosynthesis